MMKKYIFVIIITFASSFLFNSCKKESVLAEANFTFSGSLDSIPAQIQFTNNSFGISYVWDFGDGTSSKEKNPTHLYSKYGLFKVILTAIGTNNKDTLTKYINIKNQSSLPKVGLIGWWPFNGDASDESGNGNHGIVNGATLTSDRFGNARKAYNFDGVNDNINPFQNNLPFGTSARSVSIWFQRIGNGGCLFSYGSASKSNAYMIAIGSNIISNQGWAQDFPVYPLIDNSWHHLVCTFDRLKTTIYLDNNNLGSGPMSNWNTIAGSFYFGTRVLNDMDFFNGNLDDIAIWNRALTQQEITELFNLK
jgi:hypothetical protein